MITALVQFTLPTPINREKAADLFEQTAPMYREMQGLVRKYYLLSEDGGTAGGAYLWESREAAEQVYTAEWRKYIAERYGSEPRSPTLRVQWSSTISLARLSRIAKSCGIEQAGSPLGDLATSQLHTCGKKFHSGSSHSPHFGVYTFYRYLLSFNISN